MCDSRQGNRAQLLTLPLPCATAAFSNISALVEVVRTPSVRHKPVWMLSRAKSIPCWMESLGLFSVLSLKKGDPEIPQEGILSYVPSLLCF